MKAPAHPRWIAVAAPLLAFAAGAYGGLTAVGLGALAVVVAIAARGRRTEATPLPAPPPAVAPAPAAPPAPWDDPANALTEDGLIRIDPQGRIASWNVGAVRLDGRPASAMVGAPFGALFPAVHAHDALPEVLLDRAARDGVARHDGELVRADGTRWWARLRIHPAASTATGGWVVLLADETEAHEALAERERRRRTQEPSRQREDALRLRGELLNAITHDLRTPLHALGGFTELLHDGRLGPVSELQRTTLADILVEAHHLERLIQDTLDLGKVEAGRMRFKPELLALPEALEAARATLRGLAAGRELTVLVDAPAGLEAHLDPVRIKQILVNFLGNAVEHAPAGSTITLRARPSEDAWVRIEVEDEGPGIATADLPRLFEAWRQLDGTGSRTRQGTGLGLALTRRLVEAQAGRVGMHPSAAGGSVFFAVLPRLPRDSTSTQPVFFQPGDAQSVLVVDPDPDRIFGVRKILCELQITCCVAESGEAALELGEREAVDAALITLELTDMTGLDVARAIRASALRPDLPILIACPEGRLEGLAAHGVQAVIRHPVERSQVIEALAELGVTGRRAARPQ